MHTEQNGLHAFQGALTLPEEPLFLLFLSTGIPARITMNSGKSGTNAARFHVNFCYIAELCTTVHPYFWMCCSRHLSSGPYQSIHYADEGHRG